MVSLYDERKVNYEVEEVANVVDGTNAGLSGFSDPFLNLVINYDGQLKLARSVRGTRFITRLQL